MRRNLNEQIQAFRKLTGLLLNEGPGEILTRLVSKLGKVSLEDAAIAAFEGLEKKGLITIDKASKALKTVNWPAMAESDLKLIFKSRTVRTMFEEASKESGVDLSSPAIISLGGNFKKLHKAYKQAETEGLFDGGKTFIRKPATSPTGGAAIPSAASEVIVNKTIKDLEKGDITITELKGLSTDDIANTKSILEMPGISDKLKSDKQLRSLDVKSKQLETKSLQDELYFKNKMNELELEHKSGMSDLEYREKKDALKTQVSQNRNIRVKSYNQLVILRVKQTLVVGGVAVAIYLINLIVQKFKKKKNTSPTPNPTTGTNPPVVQQPSPTNTQVPPTTTKEKANW